MSADPRLIGRYAIQGVLGRGAMGTIYRAHDPDIDRPVAIKLIRADLLDGADRTSFIARFRREAQAAGRCAHPNIVAIYDFALHEGNPFLAMEFVDGMTLAQARPAGGRFPVEDAVFVMLQVLTALGAAHAMGIVHRDVKPANIMLIGGTRVKVTDFGISRLESAGLTQDGAMVGTPSYMSPEQCRGGAVDARSDLFSAGVVLYELLSAEKPFAGRNAAEVFTRLLNDEAAPIEAVCPDLPVPVRDVVMRSLAKTPEGRFTSAGEMAAALQAAAAESGTAYLNRTIIMLAPGTVAEASPTGLGATGAFDSEALDTLERKLAEYVGPIARYLVRSAVRSSETMEGLCASLASKIDRPGDRDRFEREARRHIDRSLSGSGQRTAVTSTSVIAARDLERAQAELARHMGPVARVLVKRAAVTARSASALWQAVAAHIESAEARAAFLRTAPPPD